MPRRNDSIESSTLDAIDSSAQPAPPILSAKPQVAIASSTDSTPNNSLKRTLAEMAGSDNLSLAASKRPQIEQAVVESNSQLQKDQSCTKTVDQPDDKAQEEVREISWDFGDWENHWEEFGRFVGCWGSVAEKFQDHQEVIEVASQTDLANLQEAIKEAAIKWYHGRVVLQIAMKFPRHQFQDRRHRGRQGSKVELPGRLTRGHVAGAAVSLMSVSDPIEPKYVMLEASASECQALLLIDEGYFTSNKLERTLQELLAKTAMTRDWEARIQTLFPGLKQQVSDRTFKLLGLCQKFKSWDVFNDLRDIMGDMAPTTSVVDHRLDFELCKPFSITGNSGNANNRHQA